MDEGHLCKHRYTCHINVYASKQVSGAKKALHEQDVKFLWKTSNRYTCHINVTPQDRFILQKESVAKRALQKQDVRFFWKTSSGPDVSVWHIWDASKYLSFEIYSSPTRIGLLCTSLTKIGLFCKIILWICIHMHPDVPVWHMACLRCVTFAKRARQKWIDIHLYTYEYILSFRFTYTYIYRRAYPLTNLSSAIKN